MYAALRHVVFLLILTIALQPVPAEAQRTVRDAAKQLLGVTFTESTIDSVATVLALQIATFPIGTSSGGFTLIPATDNTGRVDHKKDSFGPFFAERASTLGTEGVFTLGVNSQSTRFVSFEGLGVRNGELTSTIAVGGTIVDLNRYTFDVSTQTTSVFANFAVLDDVDVGVLVPIVKTSLSGTASALNPQSPQRIETVVDVTNTGLGDIAVRGKWNFLTRPASRAPADPLRDPGDVPITDRNYGLAAVVEVFLPTGSEDRLSTAGRVRIKPMFVASADFDGFAPHANIGYTFGGPGAEIVDRAPLLPDIVSAEASDEFNYVLGAEAWPSRSLTVFADIIGRSLRNVARFESGRRIVDVPGFGPLAVQGLVGRAGTLNLRLGAVGAKLRVLDAGLISVGLLFPLNEGGVKPGLTPVVGFEYTFGPQ